MLAAVTKKSPLAAAYQHKGRPHSDNTSTQWLLAGVQDAGLPRGPRQKRLSQLLRGLPRLALGSSSCTHGPTTSAQEPPPSFPLTDETK